MKIVECVDETSHGIRDFDGCGKDNGMTVQKSSYLISTRANSNLSKSNRILTVGKSRDSTDEVWIRLGCATRDESADAPPHAFTCTWSIGTCLFLTAHHQSARVLIQSEILQLEALSCISLRPRVASAMLKTTSSAFFMLKLWLTRVMPEQQQ